MRRKTVRALLTLVGALVSAVSGAGVGVWTATPNSGAQTIVVASDGSVHTDWGGFFSLQVARSKDHGATWQPFPGPGQGAAFYQTHVLAVDPDGRIYVAFNTGGNATVSGDLYAGQDGGASWALLRHDFEAQYLDLQIDPSSPGTLFLHSGIPGLTPVPANGHLFRSTDAGASWTEIDQAVIATGIQRSVTAVGLDPHASGRLYAASATVAFAPGMSPSPALFVSNDGGSSWTLSAANLGGILNTLVIDPFQPATLFGGGPSGIFRSDDGGLTFVLRSAMAVVQIVADPLHVDRLYAATPASGVLTSVDGGATWSALNNGLTNLAVNAVALDASGGYLYAATSSGVFVYQFPGAGTLLLNAAHPFVITLTATDQRTGRTGAGVASKINDLWGYFSIPAITGNSSNPEVFVKMLDGTALNGSYWFFYGGLTDLEYTLTVTEDATGRQKTYTKPAGSECGGSDTAAFGP